MTHRERDQGEQHCLELLRLKYNEIMNLNGHIIRSSAIFLAVSGALVKFAYDENATLTLRWMLSWVGMGMSGIYALTCICAEYYRRSLTRDLNKLYLILGLSEFRERSVGAAVGIFLAGLVAVVALVGWSFILVQNSP